jgi:ABC-type antimicrobial peptide transport system permease subunit
MTLGAQRSEVLRSILRETLTLVGIGILIGLGVALGLTRLIASQLFGLAPHDPATIVAAVILMIAVALLAGYIPGRRASRVDPMVALRYE